MRRVLSLFSRGGHTGAFGKLDDELGNIRIASITKEKLTVLWPPKWACLSANT